MTIRNTHNPQREELIAQVAEKAIHDFRIAMLRGALNGLSDNAKDDWIQSFFRELPDDLRRAYRCPVSSITHFFIDQPELDLGEDDGDPV